MAVACGAIYLHWTLSTDKSETIEFGGAIIGGGTAIYALLLNVQSGRASYAAEFIKRWNSPDFQPFRVVVGEVSASNSMAGKDLQVIRMVLSFFEEVSIAILRKDADESLLKDFFWTVAVRFFLATKPWIEKRRTDNHQPTMFAEYEKLCERWLTQCRGGLRSYTMWRMILDRRGFLSSMPALLASGAAADAETERMTRFYLVEQFQLEQGPQGSRIHEFFSKGLLPAFDRIHHSGPKIFLEAIAAPHMPLVTAIIGVESVGQIWELQKQLLADKDFGHASEQWEAGDEPYVTSSTTLLEATAYSPEIVAPEKPPAAPRIFELRIYHSPTSRQRRALDARFSGAEINIFHRVGVHPVFYSSTVFGANKPNLTYLIPFENLAAREKAWAAFGADEDWIKVRKESVERDGQITAVIDLSLHRAMAYSPVR